jgi:hypothetical protein
MTSAESSCNQVQVIVVIRQLDSSQRGSIQGFAMEKRLFQKGDVRVEREVERYERLIWRNRFLKKETRSAHWLAVPRPETDEKVVKRRGHYELVPADK